MNPNLNSRRISRLAVASLLALTVGCTLGESKQEDSTVDLRVGESFVRTSVEANVERVEREVATTRDYADTLAALEEAGALDGNEIPAAAPPSFSVTPAAGEYGLARSFISRDGCGFDGSDGQVLSEFVIDFLEEEQQYVRLFTGTESGDVLGDICVLDGRLYTCYKPDQLIDFAFAGLDARVSIRTDEQGIWSLDSRYVALTRQAVSCQGAQCDQEPAASLLELISEPMPCDTFGIAARARTASE